MTNITLTTIEHENERFGLDLTLASRISDFVKNNDHEAAKVTINQLHPADLADYFSSLDADMREIVITLIDQNKFPKILVELEPGVRSNFIELIGVEKTSHSLNSLPTDEAIHVLEDLPDHIQHDILRYLNLNIKTQLLEGLSYPEDSAGRIMHKNLVTLQENWNVGQALDYLRKAGNLPDNFNEIYVVDKRFHPVGGVLLSRLVSNKTTLPLSKIMSADLHKVKTTTDQEKVSYIFKQYDLTSVPVISEDGVLIGTIEQDDITEVVEDEAEEDFYRMGGVSTQDIHFSYFQTIKQRFPWLFVNLLTAGMTSFVISLFEHTISHVVAAAAIMPIVASMSGNAGTQTTTISVRALATNELTKLNQARVVKKEIFTSFFNGIFMAILGFGMVWFLYKDVSLAAIFSVSVVISFTLAGFVGSTIPLFLNNVLKLDPALASSVFLTAITDILGFFTFLMLVTVILL